MHTHLIHVCARNTYVHLHVSTEFIVYKTTCTNKYKKPCLTHCYNPAKKNGREHLPVYGFPIAGYPSYSNSSAADAMSCTHRDAKFREKKHLHMWKYVNIHAYRRVHMQVRMDISITYTCVHMLYVCVSEWLCAILRMNNVFISYIHMCVHALYIYIYTCMYLFTCIYTHVCIHMCAHALCMCLEMAMRQCENE